MYMWFYWEEFKLQFLFAFRHQVKSHSKILPVESLFILLLLLLLLFIILLYFFVILQTDRYNIHSQLEHCEYEGSLIPAFEYRVQPGFMDLSTVHPPSVLFLSQTFLSGNLLKTQETNHKGTDNQFNISFFFSVQSKYVGTGHSDTTKL